MAIRLYNRTMREYDFGVLGTFSEEYLIEHGKWYHKHEGFFEPTLVLPSLFQQYKDAQLEIDDAFADDSFDSYMNHLVVMQSLAQTIKQRTRYDEFSNRSYWVWQMQRVWRKDK